MNKVQANPLRREANKSEFTVQEAAHELGVAVETVRRYIREGKLLAHKKRVKGLKEIWSISKEAVERFQVVG